jgi:dienelactone hydrolase
MTIRGRLWHLGIALSLALLVTACGGGGGDSGDADSVSDGGGTGSLSSGSGPVPDPTPPGGGTQDPGGNGRNDGDPPPNEASLYAPTAGPEAAATPVILTLHDPARDKDLDMRVSWPLEGSNLPLVVFSHGNQGSMLAYDPLASYWVSYGYVVIQPDHADSYLIPLEDRVTDFSDWEDRLDDVEFILDSLDQIEASVPGLTGRIDRDRIAMAGHSFGAHTSQVLTGTLIGGVSYLDSRFCAALLISPQGMGGAFDENSWLPFSSPMLGITGTNDPGEEGQPWEWRTDPYYYSPADGNKHLLVIDGAYHNFGDIYGLGELPPELAPDAGPLNPTHVLYVQSATTAFLDAYVKGLPAAQAYLASDDMEVASDGEIDYQHK